MLITSQNLTGTAAVLETKADHNPKRQIAEICAPLLQAAVVATKKLASVENIQAELSVWPQRNENRSGSTRLGVTQLAVLASNILLGDRALLTDAIRDLHGCAPHLVSGEMQTFLDASIQRGLERSRTQAAVDSKVVNAADFECRPQLQPPPDPEDPLARAMRERNNR